jgi:hypothetical protein
VSDWDDVVREALAHAAGEMSYADLPVGTFLLEAEFAEEIDRLGRLRGGDLSIWRCRAGR